MHLAGAQAEEEEEEAEDTGVCPPKLWHQRLGDWYNTTTSRLANMYMHVGTSDATRLSTPTMVGATEKTRNMGMVPSQGDWCKEMNEYGREGFTEEEESGSGVADVHGARSTRLLEQHMTEADMDAQDEYDRTMQAMNAEMDVEEYDRTVHAAATQRRPHRDDVWEGVAPTHEMPFGSAIWERVKQRQDDTVQVWVPALQYMCGFQRKDTHTTTMIPEGGGGRADPETWNTGMAPNQVEWCKEVNEYEHAECGTVVYDDYDSDATVEYDSDGTHQGSVRAINQSSR